MTTSRIAVAGHICLDIIPTFPSDTEKGMSRIEPGRLYNMGKAVCATGGVVSNTGLALHRLGETPILIGKTGDDLFGGEIINILKSHHEKLASGMLVTPGEETSYTIVINPPGIDRSFLHCCGANDTFCFEDIQFDQLEGIKIFHFGYPPLMHRFLESNGDELRDVLRKVQNQGIVTSLDMAFPDPNSFAGKLDWKSWLKNVLPNVDLFVPSYEEILYMLDREKFDWMNSNSEKDLLEQIEVSTLSSLSEQLIAMGAKAVLLKLGDQGLYFRSSSDGLQQLKGDSIDWKNREVIAPCFEVDLVGANGAGDCTIAGFLSTLLEDISPEETLTRASAVGACNVEAADSTSGIPTWEKVLSRISSNWNRKPIAFEMTDWTFDSENSVWISDKDTKDWNDWNV